MPTTRIECPYCGKFIDICPDCEESSVWCPYCNADITGSVKPNPAKEANIPQKRRSFIVFRNADNPVWACLLMIIFGVVTSSISFTGIDDKSSSWIWIILLICNFISNLLIYLGLTCLISKIRPINRRGALVDKVVAVVVCIFAFIIWMVIRGILLDTPGIHAKGMLWPALFYLELCRGVWRWIVGVRGVPTASSNLYSKVDNHPVSKTFQHNKSSLNQTQNVHCLGDTNSNNAKPLSGYVIIAVSIIIVGIICGYIYYSSTRYDMLDKYGLIYRIDRHTGELMRISGDNLIEIEQECNKKTVVRKLTSNEIRKVDGRAGITKFASFDGTIYNGNENVVLTGFTVELEWTNKLNKDDGIRRRYKCDKHLNPFTTSEFSVHILSVNGDYEFEAWNIIDATGCDIDCK